MNSTVASGSKTNAQLGDTVATLGTLAAGRWRVSVATRPSGTIAAGDMDNVQLVVGSAAGVKLLQTATAGALVQNPEIVVDIVAASVVKLTAVANASGAAAVYNAIMVATPEALY